MVHLHVYPSPSFPRVFGSENSPLDTTESECQVYPTIVDDVGGRSVKIAGNKKFIAAIVLSVGLIGFGSASAQADGGPVSHGDKPYWNVQFSQSGTSAEQSAVAVKASGAGDCGGAVSKPVKNGSNQIYGHASQTCRGVTTQTVCADLTGVDYYGDVIATTKWACKTGSNGTVSIDSPKLKCSTSAFQYYTTARYTDTGTNGDVASGTVEGVDLVAPC